MSRKKKRKNPSQRQKTSKKGSEIFNTSFDGLVSLKAKSSDTRKAAQKPPSPAPNNKPGESRYFLEAMSDVQPLADRANVIDKHQNPDIRPAHSTRDEDLEVMAHLSDLVSGIAEMDISFSDEYIEGSVHGFSRKLMRRLKRGQFPIQDYIDLHGLTKKEAEINVKDFLHQSHLRGLRCVLVVHGRGLNSENHIPVLKELLPVWLSRGPVRKIVLAFSTARPYDGGTGAIYILLKKWKG